MKRVAFKMRLEEQMRSTEVINVEWRISRYGRYVPVAIYNFVFVNGIRILSALAHNASHIRKWNMGKGNRIKVILAGDVIPQIVKNYVEINENITPDYPLTQEQGGYEWHWEDPDIVLNEIVMTPLSQANSSYINKYK